MPIVNWALIAPEVIVCLAAVIVMLVDAFVRPTQRWITGGIAMSGIVAAAIATILLWANGIGAAASADAFNGMIVLDELRTWGETLKAVDITEAYIRENVADNGG